MPQTTQFGFSWRQPAAQHHEENNPKAPLREAFVSEQARKIHESVKRTFLGFNRGEDRAANPRVLIRMEPDRFFVELRVDVVDGVQALVWRSQWAGARFDQVCYATVKAALNAWAMGDYRSMYLVDAAGVVRRKAT